MATSPMEIQSTRMSTDAPSLRFGATRVPLRRSFDNKLGRCSFISSVRARLRIYRHQDLNRLRARVVAVVSRHLNEDPDGDRQVGVGRVPGIEPLRAVET